MRIKLGDTYKIYSGFKIYLYKIIGIKSGYSRNIVFCPRRKDKEKFYL